ncbi:hypothetical protein B9Z55_019336 [Caenorhabditis nigoni]|nr:hypothetical protein B9Z55_019336 [Caenorhabditis nigoni]
MQDKNDKKKIAVRMVKFVIAISGKRKSGKDYCTNKLIKAFEKIQLPVSAVGISHSLKEEYAKIHNLNFGELLTDGPYKEQFRKDMIRWGEEVRNKDPSVFCRAALLSVDDSDIVIVSDCRRMTDFEFFVSNYKTLTVRVETIEDHRQQRGFRFVKGIDDAESECGLDDYKFDVVLKNITGENIDSRIEKIVEKVIYEINKL